MADNSKSSNSYQVFVQCLLRQIRLLVLTVAEGRNVVELLTIGLMHIMQWGVVIGWY
jgi:hypothetical protein